VNTIAPGSIASSGLNTYDSKDTDFIRNQVGHTIPLQRFGTEAEVSAAVVFLLSPAASFITGTCLRVDGGAPNAKPRWWELEAGGKQRAVRRVPPLRAARHPRRQSAELATSKGPS
jgi:citronellol/citronellal dehydrogenase